MKNTKDIILYKDELGDHITTGDTEYKCKEVFNTYVDENEEIDEYDMRESIVEDLITNSTNFCGTSSDGSLDKLREYVGDYLHDLVRGTL